MVTFRRLSTCNKHFVTKILLYQIMYVYFGDPYMVSNRLHTLGFSALLILSLLFGFVHSMCDSSPFIYRKGSNIAYLLLYVEHYPYRVIL